MYLLQSVNALAVDSAVLLKATGLVSSIQKFDYFRNDFSCNSRLLSTLTSYHKFLLSFCCYSSPKNFTQFRSHSQDSNSVAALQVTSQIDKDLSVLDQLLEDELPLVQPKALPDHSPAPSSQLGSTIRLGDSDKEINYGGIRVIVGPGDISEECTDAIVNAVMGNFDFNAST